MTNTRKRARQGEDGVSASGQDAAAQRSVGVMGPKLIDYQQDSDSEDRDAAEAQRQRRARIAASEQNAGEGSDDDNADDETAASGADERDGERDDDEDESENVCTPEEATALLARLFKAHTERADALAKSKQCDKEMKECKRLLIPFMRVHRQPRIGSPDDGKYFSSRVREKNRGVRKNDLFDMVQRDYGVDRRKQYEREFKAITKQKVCVVDNRVAEMIERDYGAEKRKQYEHELQTLAQQKVRVVDNKITYVGMRVAGEHNIGAAPKRASRETRNQDDDDEEEEDDDDEETENGYRNGPRVALVDDQQ